MRNLCLALLLLAVTGWNVAVHVRPVAAIMPFWEQFEARYVKKEPQTDEEKAFAEAAGEKNKDTGKCWICHVKGKAKKVRNNYGQELAKLLSRKKFTTARLKREKEACDKEIQEALAKVEKLHSVPDDKASPTFGELIAAGKVPGNQKVAGAEPGAADEPADDAEDKDKEE
jgi:hypothetical protein